jgi:hypothetical protein
MGGMRVLAASGAHVSGQLLQQFQFIHFRWGAAWNLCGDDLGPRIRGHACVRTAYAYAEGDAIKVN